MSSATQLRVMEIKATEKVFSAVGLTRTGKKIMPETVGGMIFKAQEQYGLSHSTACFILAGMFQTHWPECVVENWEHIIGLVASGADADWALKTWRQVHFDEQRLCLLPENFFDIRVPGSIKKYYY